jgi:proteasome accessory factor A
MKDRAETDILFGSEWETGISVALPGQTQYSEPLTRTVNFMLARELPKGRVLPKGLESIMVGRVHMSNGGVMYMDHDHLEVCTGEHTDAKEFVANEIDDEELVLHILQQLVDNELINGALLDARVIDHSGKSWGYHLNFLLEQAFLDLAGKSDEELRKHPVAKQFALFLASWGMITGNGGMGKSLDGNGHQFFVHTKASTLTTDFSISTTGPKPLFNKKHEPLADKEKYTRLHVVCGDYNASPWGKRMSVSMPAIVLKALMLGLKISPMFEFQPNTLVDVAKTVASDPTCRKEVTLANGKRIRPIEIQRAFLQMAQKVGLHRDLSKDDRWVLEQWEMALDHLDTDPLKLTVAGWTDKYIRLDRLQKREGGWNAPKVLQFDHAFDRLGPGKPIALKRAEGGSWAEHMPPADRARFLRPQTRARLRGLFVEVMARRPWIEPTIYWDLVKTYEEAKGGKTTKFPLPEPMMSTHAELEEYLASL